MKLSAWAKQNGLSYKGAYRMWKAGQLPVPAEQLPTGTILVHPPITTTDGGVALYARVSSADQKPDLERQVARLAVPVIRQAGSPPADFTRKLLRIGKADVR